MKMQRICKISGSGDVSRENNALGFSQSNEWLLCCASEVQFWDTQSVYSEGTTESTDAASTIIPVMDLASQPVGLVSSGHKFSRPDFLWSSRGMRNVPKELKFVDDADSAYGSCCSNDLERTPSPTPTPSTQHFEDFPDDSSHSIRDDLDSAALQSSVGQRGSSFFLPECTNTWWNSRPCAAVTAFSVDSSSNSEPASTVNTISDAPHLLQPSDAESESPDESQRQFSGSSANHHIHSGGEFSIGAKRAAPTDDGEDDDDDPAEPKRARSTAAPTRLRRQLACLYAKRAEAVPATDNDCFMHGLTNILRLKEHLLRFHALPTLHCSHCLQPFNNEEELETHESVPCSVRERSLQARFNREQQEKLVDVPKLNTTQEEKWNAMWRILFPGNEEIPSPYFDDCVSYKYSSATHYSSGTGILGDRKAYSNIVKARHGSLSTLESANIFSGFDSDGQCMDSAPITPEEENIFPLSENNSASSQHYDTLSGTGLPDTKAKSYDNTSDQAPQELYSGTSTVYNPPVEVMLGRISSNDRRVSLLQQCQARLDSILPIVESPELNDLVGAHLTSKNREVFARVMVSLRKILNLDNTSLQGEDDDLSLGDDVSQSTRSRSISFGSSSVSRNSFVSHPSHDGSMQHENRPHGTAEHTSTRARQRSSINSRKRAMPPPDSDEEANEENKKKPRGGIIQHETGNGRRFACPFRKMFPSARPLATSCIHPGFTDTARMKEHLYRTYSLPEFHCSFCYEIFPDRQMLYEHVWPPQGGSQCSRSGRSPDMYISSQQMRRLRQRSRRIAEDDKWRSIFRILFQSEGETLTHIPSPYVDGHTSVTAALDHIHQRDVEPRSPDIDGDDLRYRTTLFNDIRARLQAQLNTQVTIETERLLSEILDGLDQRRRQLFSADQSAVPGLYTEIPHGNSGDDHNGSTLTEANASSFPEIPPFQPYQRQFYHPEPETDPSNLPSLFSLTAEPSQEEAMNVSGQFPNSTQNAFPDDFTPLDRTVRPVEIWQQPYVPVGWNSSMGFGPGGEQRSWNPGLPASASAEQNSTPALTSPVQASDVLFPNNQASTGNFSQPLPLRQDNEHAIGVLGEPNYAVLNQEPPSRHTNAVDYGVAYTAHYPAYSAQNLTFNNGSALSTTGAETQEDQTWSYNPHDADWGSTLATTPNSYPIQNDKAENSQDESYGLDVPSPD